MIFTLVPHKYLIVNFTLCFFVNKCFITILNHQIFILNDGIARTGADMEFFKNDLLNLILSAHSKN